MSFTSDYLKALEEEKKKKKNSSATTKPLVNNRSLGKLSYLPTNQANPVFSTTDDEDDIAPVKATEQERSWFQKGAFEDGYQFGDISRTIKGTASDIESNIAKGILGIGEGLVDTLAYVAGGIGGMLGAKEWQSNLENFVKEDLVKDDVIDKAAKNGDIITKMLLGEKSVDEVSVLGEKTDSLVQSAGQLAGTVGLQAVGVPWFITSGVTSFGGQAGDALKEGASYGEAGASALISAGAELLTEKLFGGSGLGEKGLINLEPLTKGISNKVVKALADFGVDMAAEGAEEVVSQVVSNLSTALYKEESLGEILLSEEAIDGYIESAIGGAVLGGGMNSIKVGSSIKSGKDYRTGFTTNEQKVVDWVMNERTYDAEQNGKKLTKKEKDEIYNSIVEEMDRGSISLETIEEALGGETYDRYKDTIDKENKILEVFAELYEGDELKQQVDDLMNRSERSKLATQVRQEVSELVKDDRLAESYRERARKGQRFEADLSQYDEKVRPTIQSAIDSGVLNNQRGTHEFVDFVAKVSADLGVPFEFLNNQRLKESGFAVEGVTMNGRYTGDKIEINVDSKKAVQSTVGHEITHVLEGSQLYDKLQNTLFEYAKSRKASDSDFENEYKERLYKTRQLYKQFEEYQGVEGFEKIKKEVVADLVGDYLFQDSNFVKHLSTKDRNVFQKIYDEVKHLLKLATAGSKEARELEKVKKAFEDVYRDGGKAETDANTDNGKYSLTESFTDSNGTQFDNAVLLDTDFFDGTPPRKWGEKLRTMVYERASEDPFILPIVDENGNTTLLQFASPKDRVTKDGGSIHKVLDELSSTSDNISKLAVVHVDEIISVSEENSPYYTNENSHQWLDANGWLHRNANVINRKNGNIYNLTVDIAKAADGRTILYATDGKIKKVGSVKVNSLKIKGSRQDSNFSDNVAQKSGNVNGQFSLSDSDGNQLTAEQQEYFKDSKILDRDGNLLKVYHTTNNDFTVFDNARKGENTEADNSYLGHFFTDDPDYMSQFPEFKDGKTEAYYLNIKNPIDMNNISKQAFLDIVDVTGGDVQEASELYDREYEAEVQRAKNRGDNNTILELHRLLEELTGEYYYDSDFHEVLKPNYDKLIAKGYDGIINNMDGMGWANEYIVLDSNQAKLTSNTKPTDNPDVRYSLSNETNQKLKDVGLNYDSNSETVSYSLTSLEDAFDYNKGEADYLASRLEYEAALAKAIAEDKGNVTEEEQAKAKRYLDSLFLIHDMIAEDTNRLDYEAAVGKSAWVSNAEYGGSIDFSTLCAKRRLFTGTFDAIQNEMPDTVLNENDFLQIRNLLLEKNLESPCSMCYVEGSRAKHGVYVAKWLKEYKKTNPEWVPQIADFTSTTRLEQTRINHPEAYEKYVEAMNKLSQRKPKEASVRTDYRGEILRDFKDSTTVQEKNKNGGVRFNSFSDFEVIHALDCMQVITDMARVGLNGQAYTKVKEFAEAFGNTGLKINLSLVAKDVDENGKLVMDETNGMKYAEAMDIRNRYSENVGTVIVVFNEAQLKAALADNTIDYVLPFHRSQWKKSQYTMMGLPTNTKDFTNFQNDRITNPNTGRDVKLSKIKHISQYTNDITGESFDIKDNIMPNQYWDFSKSGRENAQRYLDYINDNGMTPKFSFLLSKDANGDWVLPQDGVGDGYFKLLIDFKMYDNNGWGSPQNPVVPEFNMPYIQKMLEDYKGGHQAFPVAHDVVKEFVEGKKKGKFSLSNTGEGFQKFGDYATPASDLRFEEDIAPVTVSKTETVEESLPDDYAPMPEDPEDEYAAMREEAFASISDADAPPAPNLPIKTVKERLTAKLQNFQTELANNQRLREESKVSYDEEIARLQAEYDARKNKNTVSANDLLRRIERTKRLRDNVDADYAKRISDLEAKQERMMSPQYQTAVQRMTKQEEYSKLMDDLIGDTSTWVDKKLGISYKVNTLRRNLRDVVRDSRGNRDIAKADAIYEELQGKYNHNEAELKRESKRIKEVFADLNLNHAEDTYAHMLGEFRYNPDTTLTERTVEEFFEKHKDKIAKWKVDEAIAESRKVFDDLLVRVNERLKEQGMKEIPYRKGYFPHFTNPKQSKLAKLFNWKTIDTEIPTSIAGITEAFNPDRSWQSFNKQRTGDTTDYSLQQGLDMYIHGALDWIYHIEDIQKRRAFENHIRYTHSAEGVKAKIDAIRKNEEYDADEMQDQIDLVYAEANNPLNNFVTDLRAGTNTLANKKSSMDRAIEEKTNRKVYSVMTNLNNRINANMVVGSLSSALTNIIPITQSWVEVSPVNTLKAMGDTIRSTIRDDGVVNESDFLTNRLMNEENLYKTGWDKASEKVAFVMEAIDNFTAQTVWRSKYIQNVSEGMSASDAIKNADQFAENVIAGRSRGNQPTIFDAKNPVTKIFTAFQLEVSNQYAYMFKDAPQDSKTKARLIKGYATAFMGANLYNALYSSLVGRKAAFDPISIIGELLKDLGLFGEDEEEPEDIILNLTENVVKEIPFVGGLLGGGRIPISSALPYSGEYEGFSKFVDDISSQNFKGLAKEMLQPLYYLALPLGGGQIKKTNEGMGMFSDDHPVSGSYTDSGKLRFPVEDTFGNRLQAGLFGQYASKNARDYFDNGYTALNEKQIQELIDSELSIEEYRKYREGLKGKDTLGEKVAYIANLDIPIRSKNVLVNNIADREEPIDLTYFGKYDDWGEFEYAHKYPEKYDFLKDNNITVEQYESFDDDTKDAWSWAYQNPEKFAVSKAISSDVTEYRRYAKDIYNLSADKDEEGKSISGSKKQKVIDYINNLNLDYGAKIVLFKSQYPADNSYNRDIVEYLNSRDDITYSEMVTILRELEFTVLNDGTVQWEE